jgi:hypothetical protein
MTRSSLHLFKSCGSVAARRIPADCRSKLSVSNPSQSQRGRRSAEIRWCGSAAPVARPYDRTDPVSGRDCRSMMRTGAPFGAPPRRCVFRVPGGDFRQRKKPFELPDPAGFRLRSSAPPARTEGPMVLGRSVDPRPPEVRLTKPDPQAPHPCSANRTPPEGALSEQGWQEYRRGE